MVELPGVGACPRPVDIDQSVTGFSDLVSLRVYTFACGMVIDGEAEEDELFIVLMRGTIDVEVAGASTNSFTLQTNVGARAVYLPPHDRYRLRARSDADVAYTRAKPRVDIARIARAFECVDGSLTILGYADSMSVALSAATHSGDRALSELAAPGGERLIHARLNDSGAIWVAGQPLHDWQTLALNRDDGGNVEQATGSATILVVASA